MISARHVLSNGGADCSELLQLLEGLCRHNDKLMEDAKREREDLQQQVNQENFCSKECTYCMYFYYIELVCYIRNSCGVLHY